MWKSILRPSVTPFQHRLRTYAGHAKTQEPGGYFLGLKSGRPLYFWEPYWYIGFYGSFVLYFSLEYFAPKVGPNERARIEANRRMAQRGEDAKAWPFPAS
ncbi:hypothetical protein BC833DRAFT_619431 [Globomyces pollinis-pini]|nr:hypothetical protein BC833DRAFT_619431 [Globomyces pollinis-pini]